MPMTRGIARSLAVAVALLPPIVLFVDLGTPPLWDPDEGRHAEIAREMLLTREWLVPQLNFEPYPEKLPAYYWVVAASLRALPFDSELAARLPSALLALAGIWATAWWGAKTFGTRAGLVSALLLATTAGWVGAGRLAHIDGPYSVLLSLALLAMGRCLLDERTSPWPFWILLALTILVRGPIAVVLAVLTAAVWLVTSGDWPAVRRLRPLSGALLLVATLGPAAALLEQSQPGYLEAFFWRHNVLRFVSANLPGGHEETLLFYVWMTPVLMLPWSLLLPWSILDGARATTTRAERFLLSWAAVVILFFSLSAAKVVSYVIPALVPFALLIGRSLDLLLEQPVRKSRVQDPLLAAGTIVFVSLVLSPLVAYPIAGRLFPMYADRAVYLLLLAPFAVPGLAAVAMRNRPAVLASLLASTAATIIGLYRFGSPTVSSYNSLEVPAALIVDGLPPEAPLVSYGTTSHSLAFYARRPVRSLDTIADASSVLQGTGPAALLTKERHLEEVRGVIPRALHYWWESDSKKVLLVNRPPPSHTDSRILLPRGHD